MKNMTRIMAFIVAATLAQGAWALDLASARSQQLVGEGTDGYVVAISGGSEAKALVSEVNAKRRAEYTRIAKEKGQGVEVVAKLAAQEIIGNLPAGSKYMGAGGSWQTK